MTYACIVADPPWQLHRKPRYRRGTPEMHYPTMTADKVAEMAVSGLAADDAHLWLWGTNQMLKDAYSVVSSWGFKPITVLTWCKPGPGVGYYLRNNTEHCIFATRGRPMVPEHKALSSWYVWPRKRHSEKPAEFFEVVEQVSPAPRLELFARASRPGWDSWGNEAPDSIEWIAV